MKILALALPLFFAAPQDDERIDRLIRDLGSDDFETREKATAELKKIGKPAVPALRKAAESDDAEVKLRAKKLLEDIEAEKPPPRRGVGSIQIQSANGDTTYALTPAEGEPFTFHRRKDGSVALEVDGKEVASADSLEEFLEEYADFAKRYGITNSGIQYGGLRASFRGKEREFPIPSQDPEDLLRELEKQMEELRRQFGGFGWDEDFFSTPRRSQAHGATFEGADETLRSHLEIPEGVGLVVRRVAKGSLADRFGLRKHDILLEIDGTDVVSTSDVQKLLSRDSTVTILRGGKKSERKSKDE